MLIRYIHARITLGWALLVHVVKSLFVRRHPAMWTQRLRLEGIAPTPQQAWHLLPQVSRCISCGLCDLVVPRDIIAPSVFLTGFSRQPADALLVLDNARLLRPFADDIARVCPVRVDVLQVVLLIEQEAEALAP